MEREAFIRSLNFLLPRIKCTEIITDASTSIRNILGLLKVSFLHNIILLVAADYPNIFHSFDVWHKAKKFKKALAKVYL